MWFQKNELSACSLCCSEATAANEAADADDDDEIQGLQHQELMYAGTWCWWIAPPYSSIPAYSEGSQTS